MFEGGDAMLRNCAAAAMLALLDAMSTEEPSTPVEDTRSREERIEELTVIMVIGANGMGKTTTIGKLANRLQSEAGLQVMLSACDTFRSSPLNMHPSARARSWHMQ